MDGNEKTGSVPVHRDGPGLKVPIAMQFMVPTFPRLEMFLAPPMTVAAVEEWHLWLEERLNRFLRTGTPFFEANRVVLFPDAFPYQGMGFQGSSLALLQQWHKEICALARMAVMLETTDRMGSQVAVEHAMATIQKILAILRQPQNPAAMDRAPQGKLQDWHGQWMDGFLVFMNKNLENGVFLEQEIFEFANYRPCPVSRWIYEEQQQQWFGHQQDELRQLEMHHKNLHAVAQVEAMVAKQLRRKGLTREELGQVKTLVQQRLLTLKALHQQFLDIFPDIFARFDRKEHPVGRSNRSPPAVISWDRVCKDVQEWKGRILRYVESGKPDPDLEKTLSHVGCPTGKRIEVALADASLFYLNEFTLKLLDRSHMQFHATGSTLYALTAMGYRQDAFLLVESLQQEEKDLLEHLHQAATLLNITNAAAWKVRPPG